MKKTAILALGFLALGLALLPVSSALAATSWTGWISDSHCGAAGAKAGHEECAKKCVKGGGKYIFVNSADKKVFQIDNQELASQHLAGEVVLTGTAEGDAIKVDSIAAKQ